MNNLRIYRIDEKYIRFLWGSDHRVQYNKGQRRPYIGVVLTVAEFRYFVPMESPKPNHAKLKPGKHILKIDRGRYGLLGFNNMVPVHEAALIEIDIDKEPDEKYRNLLKRQVRHCNSMKGEIYHRANETYFDVVNKKNKFLLGISCDFRKLERACKAYDPEYKKKK